MCYWEVVGEEEEEEQEEENRREKKKEGGWEGTSEREERREIHIHVLASFFLPSHLSLKHVHNNRQCTIITQYIYMFLNER